MGGDFGDFNLDDFLHILWKSSRPNKAWSLGMIHGSRIPDPTNGQAVWSTWTYQPYFLNQETAGGKMTSLQIVIHFLGWLEDTTLCEMPSFVFSLKEDIECQTLMCFGNGSVAKFIFRATRRWILFGLLE